MPIFALSADSEHAPNMGDSEQGEIKAKRTELKPTILELNPMALDLKLMTSELAPANSELKPTTSDLKPTTFELSGPNMAARRAETGKTVAATAPGEVQDPRAGPMRAQDSPKWHPT